MVLGRYFVTLLPVVRRAFCFFNTMLRRFDRIFGLVWFGVVWFGLVWFGAELCVAVGRVAVNDALVEQP